MATITGKTHLFFVTSPRSPYKMRDEIKVLIEHFGGQKWEGNRQLQVDFYKKLAAEDFFTGTLTGELDFKARDRITRAPKALGFVDLYPQIALTDAGKTYVYGNRPHEIFTRQLLKFQMPSPYHLDKRNSFFIKPYLELLRLTYDLDTLSKDEIAAFVTQLINFQKYDEVKNKIKNFRKHVSQLDRGKTNYKRYFDEVFSTEISLLYTSKLVSGEVNIRESRTATVQKFIRTKKNNHKDYADAAIRYLRETQLVSMKSGRSTKIYIPEEKKAEVTFILNTVLREPQYINDISEFKAYLFDSAYPVLYTDDGERLANSILDLSTEWTRSELLDFPVETLKNLNERLIQDKRDALITEQINQLQLYDDYDDIQVTYQNIKKREIFDAPLMMEWNTWRAFVMLDDGDVIGNFRFDDVGIPLSTASGNRADIVCKYADFDVLVEVTLSSGKRQYEMEGEPVARHLGNHQKQSSKDVYCIFIAQKLNPATLVHFYMLHQYETAYYGGIVRIIPMSLPDFQMMLKQAYRCRVKPTALTIKTFVQKASQLASSAKNEVEWYDDVKALTAVWI